MMRHLFIIISMLSALTVNAQVAKVYDEVRDPMAQIDSALVVANSQSKHVVCQVGGNWCPWCLRFADFITKDEEIKALVDANYVYIHVNWPRRDGNPLVSERLGRPARFGFPVLVVLDDKGNVLHIQDSSFLEEGKGYNKEKVQRFFKCWTPSALKD